MSNPGSDADDFNERLWQMHQRRVDDALKKVPPEFMALVREYFSSLDAFRAMFTNAHHEHWEVLEQGKDYAEKKLRAVIS